MKLGIEKTAMIRVRAGISYALTDAMDDAHCGLPTDELRSLAEGLLEVPVELVQTALLNWLRVDPQLFGLLTGQLRRPATAGRAGLLARFVVRASGPQTFADAECEQDRYRT
jgi:hypothetical protein